MKKLVSLILAIMMIAAVGAAWASSAANISENDTNESYAGVRGYEEQANLASSVILLKELVIYNTDGKAIYLPDVDYSYTIAPAGTAGAELNVTNTDTHGHTGAVYAGLTTHSATVSFRYDETAYSDEGLSSAITQPVTAASTGTSVYNGFTIDFSNEGFTHPGIYRYSITEADGTSTRASAGVVTATTGYSNTRYLDVYVRGNEKYADGDTIPSGKSIGDYKNYAIYGYVCFTTAANTSINGTTSGSNLDTVKKTNGFVHGGTDLATVADQYKTYNLEVSKAITGSLAETGHKFPFDIDLASTLTGSNIKLNGTDTTADVSAGITSNVATLGTTLNIDAAISNGKVVKLYGIPDETALTVNVKETNDTYDVYTATATVNSTSATLYASNGTTAVTALSRNNTAQIAPQTIAKNTLTDEVVALSNAITEISPTGYVSRFAPYALILIGGIALLIIAKKRKPKEE
jgi:hypothetical protein